jgi:superoxide reductase
MTKLEEQYEDQSIEKHVPYISDLRSGYKVKVGKEESHPMNEIHHIEMIELTVDGHVYKKFMLENDDSEADFFVARGENVSARAYCNLHGLWTDTPKEEE